ncbi:MAG TPA: MG2 domain-containing protein, partial [Chitinophagaceae bacterium]|nr:MG2 domain-containing protein [Chitinophagaceae bacterium]
MMRTIFFVLAMFTFLATMGQTPTDYNAKWKQVEDLMNNRGLVKTAIAEIQKIYALAIKEKQESQQIRALIYLSNLEENLDEEGEAKGISKLENELKNAKAPVAQILHAVLAGKYYNYFQQNRWRLYDRTATQNTGDSLAGLGIEELHQKISYHYLQSLKDAALLQNTRLEKYDPLIEKGNVRNLRPTLYDMLAHQALEYFENDERDLKKPSYSFTINDVRAFAPAAEFIQTNFQTSDTTSLYHRALLIYQQLLAFHAKDNEPSALIDADLHRLAFMHMASVIPNKDQLYNESLLRLQNKYFKHPLAAQAGVTRLENLYNDAMEYQPGISDPSKRFALQQISKDLKTLADAHPGTDAEARAKNLLQNIHQETVSAKTELVNLPGKPFLSLVSFKNLHSFHYRILKVDNIEDIRRTSSYDDFWIRLVNLKPLKQVRQNLPGIDDHREHKVEVKIDPLPAGDYALLCSTSDNFSLTANELTIQFFHVSQIAYMKKGDNYFILDRESGSPLVGAEVKLMSPKYDGGRSRTVYELVSTKKANSDGYLKLDMPAKANNYALDIKWKNDRLFTKRGEYHYQYDPASSGQKEVIMTSIFTDRSIYRPGQTVYFKGIKIRRNISQNKSSVVAGVKTVVSLYDANGQKKDSLQLTTNQFGSYHGSFRIPENLLTGNFSIRDDNGRSYTSFGVEEYKRPSFEIV